MFTSKWTFSIGSLNSNPSANHIIGWVSLGCLTGVSRWVGGHDTHLVLAIPYWLLTWGLHEASARTSLAPGRTWDGTYHPTGAQTIWQSVSASGRHAQTLLPHSTSRVECFWCVSQTLNCLLFRFSTVSSLSYLYLLWKRPSSYASPCQEFGNTKRGLLNSSGWVLGPVRVKCCWTPQLPPLSWGSGPEATCRGGQHSLLLLFRKHPVYSDNS